MAKKRHRFYIGQYVKVKATCTMQYLCEDGKEDKGPWVRQPVREECDPFTGVIVGARRRQCGEYVGAGWRTFDPKDGGEAYLECTGTVLVWLVAEAMLNKPHEVLDEDVCLWPTQEFPPVIPWKRNDDHTVYTPEQIADLRKWAKESPRDKCGRFVKYCP